MFSSDPKDPVVRFVAGLIGLAAIGFGLHALFRGGDLHYTNWLGELVFAPVAILLGAVAVFGALFKPQILGRPPARSKR